MKPAPPPKPNTTVSELIRDRLKATKHSPKELAPPALATALYDQRVQTQEDEVQELRQQVRFLEQLLHERHAAETEPFGNR